MIHHRKPPTLDMTPDGAFRVVASRPALPAGARLAATALTIAVLAGTLGLAALAFWFALVLIPIALLAGLIGWAALRLQIWRLGASREVMRRNDTI